MPNLTTLTPEQLARFSPTGWSTVRDRSYSTGCSTVSVKHQQIVKLPDGTEERLFFWHDQINTDDCDVCTGQAAAVKNWANEQMVRSFGIPSLNLENSNLSGTGQIAGRASGFQYGSGNVFQGLRRCEHSWCDPQYACQGNRPPEYTSRVPLDPPRPKLHTTYDTPLRPNKTPQELYDEAWHKFVDAPDTDVALLEPMLAQVSDDVTGLSERPRDERPVAAVRRWTWADTRCAVFWICTFLAIFFSIAH